MGLCRLNTVHLCVSLCGPHLGFRTSCWISIAGHVTCHVTFYIELQARLIYEFFIKHRSAKNDPDCCSMTFSLIIVVRHCCWLFYYVVAGYRSMTVLLIIIVRHCCWVLFHYLSHSNIFLQLRCYGKTQHVISAPTNQIPSHVLMQALKFLSP